MRYSLDFLLIIILIISLVLVNLSFFNEKLIEIRNALEKYYEFKANVCDSCSQFVHTSDGSIRGCAQSISNQITDYQQITVYSFKGIPYAEPPLGKLRFRKPLPKKKWGSDVIDATHYRSPCMQPLLPDWPFPSGLPSEDCLFLNIWSPIVDPKASLPVMVWIHGGSFFSGSGSQHMPHMGISFDNIYDGSLLSVKDVVVVTFNYRLGVFGFLYANRSDCPGNMGYWDQALALNWIKNNIQRFGGNPNDITLFGNSAGSISISNHIVSNVTRNLFQKAILQSGTAYVKQFSKDTEYAYSVSRRFASNSTIFKSGVCDDDNDWVDCLRNRSAAELIARQTGSVFWSGVNPWYVSVMTPFLPVFGDEFINISVNKAVKEGNFRNDIKILMGHNEMEGLSFAFAIDITRILFGRYNPFLPISTAFTKNVIYNDIKNLFFDNQTIGTQIAKKYTENFTEYSLLNQNSVRRSAVHSFGDFYLICPTILFGGHIVKSKTFSGKVFQYRYTHKSVQSISFWSSWSEATHNDELPMVFGKPFHKWESMTWLNRDREISDHIMNIWTYFAKYGSVPKVNGNEWPEYGLNNDKKVNASYIELNYDPKKLGKVFIDRYNGFDKESNSSVINNCFKFWDQIISNQF